MNDTETLNWVAEHVVSFRPQFGTAWMSFVDDEGYEQEIVIQYLDGNVPSCIDQFRECVKAARKNELVQS